MKHNEEAYRKYQDNFPSTEFLKKHFGPTFIIPGNPHRGTVSTDLYTGLRRVFGEELLDIPECKLELQNSANAGFTPVYVFKEGTPESWVDDQLERRGLMVKLDAEAFRELCAEFIVHFQNGAFENSDWWHWRCEGNSIWVEVIPEAIATGKNIEQPGSLMELLFGTKTN